MNETELVRRIGIAQAARRRVRVRKYGDGWCVGEKQKSGRMVWLDQVYPTREYAKMVLAREKWLRYGHLIERYEKELRKLQA